MKEKSTFSPTFIAEESSGKCTTTAAGVVISSKLLKTDGRYEVMLEKITPKNTELKIVVSDSSNSCLTLNLASVIIVLLRAPVKVGICRLSIPWFSNLRRVISSSSMIESLFVTNEKIAVGSVSGIIEAVTFHSLLFICTIPVMVTSKEDSWEGVMCKISLVNQIQAYRMLFNYKITTIWLREFLFSEDYYQMLSEISLAFNTRSKTVKSFALHLQVYDWQLLSKVSLTLVDLYMNYSGESWGAAFKANAFFDNEYSVSINFNLPSSDEEAVLEFNNDNQAFSLAKFFNILDLEVLESIPVISDLLQISIVSAKLHITKPGDSSEISMQEGKVSIYVESIALNSSVTLKQVNTDISFYKNPSTNRFDIGFKVAGFINDDVYVDLGYDPEKSILCGRALISSFKEVDLSSVAGVFF